MGIPVNSRSGRIFVLSWSSEIEFGVGSTLTVIPQPSNVRQSGFDNVVPSVEAFHGETRESKKVRRVVEGNMLQTEVSIPVVAATQGVRPISR